MKTPKKHISAGVVIAIAVAVFVATRSAPKIPTCTIDQFTFEIAQTDAEKAQGLMNRKNLCANCGMIFVYPDEQIRSFWMKDTLIPLDIYFFDAQWRFTENMLNMRPMGETKDPMRRKSRKPAQYVIEVNAWIDFNTDLKPQECLRAATHK